MVIRELNEIAEMEWLKQYPATLEALLIDGTRQVSNEIDRSILALLKEYENNYLEISRSITEELSKTSSNLLNSYAFICSIVGVRLNRSIIIQNGLLSLFVGGASIESRDAIITLAVLHRSCLIIGKSPDKLFREMARRFPQSPMAQVVYRFLERTPDDKSIETFQLTEENNGLKFNYIQTSFG
jgi:hypothetical protein